MRRQLVVSIEWLSILQSHLYVFLAPVSSLAFEIRA